jgi:hypothetical protein
VDRFDEHLSAEVAAGLQVAVEDILAVLERRPVRAA